MVDRMSEEFYQAFANSEYDGNGKYLTKDCIGCDYYRRVTVDTYVKNFPPSKSRILREDEEMCYWGKSRKVLKKGDKMTRCNSLNSRISPRRIAFGECGGKWWGIGEPESSKIEKKEEFGMGSFELEGLFVPESQ